jgi:hypothetical protein
MHAVTRLNPMAKPDPEPLAQVEVLFLFHPAFQGGIRRVPGELCARATQGWLTLDVHGTPGLSELTGQPILEDMRLETHGQDMEALLPDQIVTDIAGYALENSL